MISEVLEVGNKNFLLAPVTQILSSLNFTLPEVKLSPQQKRSITLTLATLALVAGCGHPSNDPENPHRATARPTVEAPQLQARF